MQKKCDNCKYKKVAIYKEPGKGEWHSESCDTAFMKRPFCKRYLETNEESKKEKE